VCLVCLCGLLVDVDFVFLQPISEVARMRPGGVPTCLNYSVAGFLPGSNLFFRTERRKYIARDNEMTYENLVSDRYKYYRLCARARATVLSRPTPPHIPPISPRAIAAPPPARAWVTVGVANHPSSSPLCHRHGALSSPTSSSGCMLR